MIFSKVKEPSPPTHMSLRLKSSNHILKRSFLFKVSILLRSLPKTHVDWRRYKLAIIQSGASLETQDI